MMNVVDKESDPVVYWARNNNIPVNLMQIIIKTVSNFNPVKMDISLYTVDTSGGRYQVDTHAFYKDIKYGLCQLKGSVALENGFECSDNSGLTKLFDVPTNLEHTCKYLRKLKEEYYLMPEEWGGVLREAYPEHADEILKEYDKYLKSEFDYLE